MNITLQTLVTHSWKVIQHKSNVMNLMYLTENRDELYIREYNMATATALTGETQFHNEARYANGSINKIRHGRAFTVDHLRGQDVNSLTVDLLMINTPSIRMKLIEALSVIAVMDIQLFILDNNYGTINPTSLEVMAKKLGVQ